MIIHDPLSQTLDPVQEGVVLGDVVSGGTSQARWQSALVCDKNLGNVNCRPFGNEQITNLGGAL